MIGQEGTAVDVAGCISADVDGASILRSFCTQQLVQNGGQGLAGERDFSPALTSWHGERSLFGHPRSISSPIVQVHVVVWKGEAEELWVKLCALLLAMSRPGRDFEHLSREWRGERWILSLLTYIWRMIRQEGS